MFRRAGGKKVQEAAQRLKRYPINEDIYMNRKNLKEFFGKTGIMTLLASSNQTNRGSNFFVMDEVITLKYQEMKIESLIQGMEEAMKKDEKDEKDEESEGSKLDSEGKSKLKEISQQLSELVNSDERIKDILKDHKRANNWEKAGIAFFGGGVVLSALIITSPLALLSLVGEIASFSKSTKLGGKVQKEIRSLLDSIRDLKVYIKKYQKENDKAKKDQEGNNSNEQKEKEKAEFTFNALKKFKAFLKVQGEKYVEGKKRGKSNIRVLIDTERSPMKHLDNNRAQKRDQKALKKLAERETAENSNIDTIKLHFAMCIQHFTMDPKFEKVVALEDD